MKTIQPDLLGEVLDSFHPALDAPSGEEEASLVQALIDEGVARCVQRSLEEAMVLGPTYRLEEPEMPEAPDLFPASPGLREISVSELNGKNLASGLVHHGAFIVRGLYGPDHIARLKEIAAFEERAKLKKSANARCADRTLLELLKIYRDCGLLDSVREYLGEVPVMLKGRTEVRTKYARADGPRGLPWHQDVNFFGGKTYAVNCWATATGCGADSPSLGIVPRRLHERIGWDAADGRAPLGYGKGTPEHVVEEVAARHPTVEVILGPGDALFFDEMALHRSGLTPWSADRTIVTISWFFRASRFPDGRTPIAV